MTTPPPDPPRPSGATQTVRCPDCLGSGKTPVEGQTLTGGSRPCMTCDSGRVDVWWWASQLDGQTHLLITTTERCLCGHRIPQTKGAVPGSGRMHQECLDALVSLQPTAAQRARWT